MAMPGDVAVSDRMLRVFDAAARHGSLTAAARALDIGQPAVSHAVARLEAGLGTDLFLRSPSGVSLTPAGLRLHRLVQGPLDEIDAAVAAARNDRNVESVTLSVSTSLASYWLMPRLPDFKRRHPTVELRVITCDSDRAVGVDDADVWIPLGRVERRDLSEVALCPERVVPVATQSVAEKLPSIDPVGLAHAPLLHLEERYEPRFDWARWFSSHGVQAPVDQQGYRSNDYSVILQAALEGQGVALGWVHIVADLVDQGRLVTLGEPVETDQPFKILTRTSRPLSEAAEAVRNWLQRQAPA